MKVFLLCVGCFVVLFFWESDVLIKHINKVIIIMNKENNNNKTNTYLRLFKTIINFINLIN